MTTQELLDAIIAADIDLVIETYILNNKALVDGNDCYNIAGFTIDTINTLFGWHFKTLPKPTAEELYNLINTTLVRKQSLLVKNKINHYKQRANIVLEDIKIKNILSGITIEQSFHLFEQYNFIISMIKEGAFETAIYALQQKTPNEYITQELINTWISALQAELI